MLSAVSEALGQAFSVDQGPLLTQITFSPLQYVDWCEHACHNHTETIQLAFNVIIVQSVVMLSTLPCSWHVVKQWGQGGHDQNI